jgi:hypothetical protein
VEIREGEGFNRGISIGLLLPPRCQPNRTKRKGVLKISWIPEKILADPFSSLGRFGKRKRREGDTWQV